MESLSDTELWERAERINWWCLLTAMFSSASGLSSIDYYGNNDKAEAEQKKWCQQVPSLFTD